MRKRSVRLFVQLLGAVMVIMGLSLYFFVSDYGGFLRNPASQSLATYFLESGLFSVDDELSISRTHSTFMLVCGEKRVEVEFAESEQEAARSLALHKASFAERNLTPPGLLYKDDKVFIFSPSDPVTTAIVSSVDLSHRIDRQRCADALIRDVRTREKTVEAYAKSHPGIYGNLLNPMFYSLYTFSAVTFVRPLVSSPWMTSFVGNLGLAILGIGVVAAARTWGARSRKGLH